ncbi:putative alpha-1,2-mannosidase [Pedobacter sp. UYP30]|uniref:glycoside hydrolase domain-containing protein n=1 Tax=Pedobacter sp. UYP30 TaxID=1756400 RepID=UPI003396407F
MKHYCTVLTLLTFFWLSANAQNTFDINKQRPTDLVNVFLGTSGDHGQMSPAASYPFSMMSIGPQTYPKTHTGYEYLAKIFEGFTHNRFEGVGCTGSGGNILIKPFSGEDPSKTELIKTSENANPGYYHVGFKNGIEASFTVVGRAGKEQYVFPKGKKGLYIDLGYAFNGAFVDDHHQVNGSEVTGWFISRTTCGAGKYKIFYQMQFGSDVKIKDIGNRKLMVEIPDEATTTSLDIAFSSVSETDAGKSLVKLPFNQAQAKSSADWNKELGKVEVAGDLDNAKLFYSLLYRTMQSPYLISEPNGDYRNNKGEKENSKVDRYNGWAIWDNYRTQLPLLSIVQQDKYQGMINSIADLYNAGKKDYATQTEPSNTVRTEHAVVVLLDAYRKGYAVEFKSIADSLVKEIDGLDFKSPDKALESSYDNWALSQIFGILKNKEKATHYLQKALNYKSYWNKDFKDVTRNDVDRVGARGLYQGTIWQYRWFVPFDVKGLIALEGGEEVYLEHLDTFFAKDLYNHANEPDLQVPLMYNATNESYKSQYWMHQLAADTVIQNYFNDNSRGIGSYIGKIYKNQPAAYLRTMDDDAGAMSAWYVFAASGFSPACVGWPVYYLNVPLFPSVTYRVADGKKFQIKVKNFSLKNRYIKSIQLNGSNYNKNYISQDIINAGGLLTITASSVPQKSSTSEIWVSEASK